MEKNRQGKPKRRQYLNDFPRTVGGEYVYTGGFARPAAEPERYARWRRRLAALAAASAVFVLGAGMLPAAGSAGCVYVALPFLALILCCFVKLWKTARLLMAGQTVREYVYEKTVPALPGWIAAEALSAAAVLLGEGVYLLRRGFEGRAAASIAFLVLAAAAAAADLLLLRVFRAMEWRRDGAEKAPEA